MTAKRLGKGISAIIPDLPPLEDIESVHTVNEIDINTIKTNPHQPRKQFNAEALAELKQSIDQNGLIQPITIRQAEDGYELIAGERRLRACKELGKKQIPAYVLPIKTDVEMMELALIENVQREDLNPIEVAEAYQVLYDTFDMSHEDIAKRVGKKRSTVTNFLRLLNLPAEIIRDLRDGKMTSGHARPLLNIDSESRQMNLWRRIKDEGLSVRKVEQLVKNLKAPAETITETAPPAKKPRSSQLNEIEERLMHITGAKVRVKGNEDKGSLEIAYYSVEDLNRLLDLFDMIEEKNQ